MPAQNALEILEELRQSWEVAINTCQSEWTLTITQPTTARSFFYRGASVQNLIWRAWAGEPDDRTTPRHVCSATRFR